MCDEATQSTMNLLPSGTYHQSCRGILRLCRGVTPKGVCFVNIFVVSFYFCRALCEACVLSVLQTLQAPHSTLYTFAHMVVHLGIPRLSHLFGLRSKVDMCLCALSDL